MEPEEQEWAHNNEAFDNRSFWSKRYREDPALGSGVGSRGENLFHKRAIIRKFLTRLCPQTILDVGCGDHKVLSGVAMSARYHGIDISPIIIDENKRKYADKRFTCIDFSHLDNVDAFKSDIVLCFEVLIHQHTFEAYRALLKNVVRAARVGGIVSGYLSNPKVEFSSDIIAWHESVIESLEELGATEISICGRSLETDKLAFVSFRSTTEGEM